MRLKVGVVGCGLIAQITHIPNILKLDELYELKAVCDLSPSTVEKIGERYNIANRYQDYQQLLKDDIDVVFILTRDHYDIALAAIESGKHLFIEKPIAFNVYQAKEIVNAASRKNVLIMVGYMRRFDSGIQKARDIISTMNGTKMIRYHASLGSPDHVVNDIYDVLRFNDIQKDTLDASRVTENEQITKAIGSDEATKSLAYRLLIQLWIHEIDLLRSLFGVPVNYLYFMVRKLEPSTNLPACQIGGIFNFGEGNTGIWESQAFMANKNWDDRIEVYGSDKTIKISLANPYLPNTPSKVEIEEFINGEFIIIVVNTAVTDTYLQELKYFCKAIKNKQPVPYGDEAIKDLEIAANMINRSVIID